MSSVVNTLVGGITGNAGGAGANYQASAAPIVNNYANADQSNQLYNGALGDLGQQQAFVGALQAQNGLQNQSDVYNQLQGIANGTGPNPAQAQLAQSTGANVANQAALMAGQRGAGQNAGLIARQAAQQGGNLQQQAAGQAATMQANQSLNAINSMGGLATSQTNQLANQINAKTNAGQAEQGQVLGALGAQNQAINSSIGSQNAANAGIASGVAQGQFNLIGNLAGGAGSAATGPAAAKAQGGMVHAMASGGPVQPMAQGSTTPLAATPGATSGPQSNVGKYLSGLGTTQSNPQMTLGQGANQLGQAIGTGINKGWNSLFGSSTPDSTGPTGVPTADQNAAMYGGPGSAEWDMTHTGGNDSITNQVPGGMQAEPAMQLPAANDSNPYQMNAKGGQVNLLLSPGERYLSPDKAKAAAMGKANPMKDGAKVPGTPKVAGAKNSYANDTVAAKGEEGAVVIPRSITHSKGSDKEKEKKAIAFVRASMAKSASALKQGK